LSLYDVGLWISQIQLWGNRLNILGLVWLFGLTYYSYRQIRKPITELRATQKQKRLGMIRMLLLALIPVVLTHFITDEIWTLMTVTFGNWPLTFWQLLYVKADVYLAIAALSLMFIQLDLYARFGKPGWRFILFFGLWFLIHVYSGIVNIGDYAAFQGWERFWRFWLFYPSVKGLLALCYLSLLKRSSPFTWGSLTGGISISGIRITISLWLANVRALRYKPKSASLFRSLNPFQLEIFPELIRKTLSHFGLHFYRLQSRSDLKIDSYLFVDGQPILFYWDDRAEVLATIKEIMTEHYYGPPHPGVTVDVGANVGIYSLWASRASRVIAIEPLERTWETLRLNTRSENVLPLKLAIGKEPGQRKLFLSEVTAACSLRSQGLSSSYVWVETKRLDDLFAELGLDRVDTLKIDCEGAEIEILESAGLFLTGRKIGRLIIASYHYPSEVQEVVDLLRFCGYSTVIQKSSEVIVFGLALDH